MFHELVRKHLYIAVHKPSSIVCLNTQLCYKRKNVFSKKNDNKIFVQLPNSSSSHYTEKLVPPALRFEDVYKVSGPCEIIIKGLKRRNRARDFYGSTAKLQVSVTCFSVPRRSKNCEKAASIKAWQCSCIILKPFGDNRRQPQAVKLLMESKTGLSATSQKSGLTQLMFL